MAVKSPLCNYGGQIQELASGDTLAGTSGGGSSPLTTKGDLYGRSSTADARVPVGADGQRLVADSSAADGVSWKSGGVGAAFYGDGSDGALVFDGTTSISGSTLSGSTYTLTRDILATNLTVNAGVTLCTGGNARIFCTGTLTNNGTITASTHDASGITGGSAALGAPNYLGTAGSGATGRSTSGVGAAGSSLTTFGIGGAGGAGGTSGSSAGGAGGTCSGATASKGTYRTAINLLLGFSMAGFGSQAGFQPGAGGGAGGYTTGTNSGGGGGGGEFVIIFAFIVINNGTITAPGGHGGDATGSGNAGGGGGGGGGVVGIVYGSYTGNLPTAPGGVGGAKIGTGVAGSNGSVGLTLLIQN